MQVEKRSEESDLKSARLGLPALLLDGEEEWGGAPLAALPLPTESAKNYFSGCVQVPIYHW